MDRRGSVGNRGLVAQVTRALVAAEARGVLQRNLKPSNTVPTTSRREKAGGSGSMVVRVIDRG